MDYITIKEAVSLTRKSEATIRRLIKKAILEKPKKAKKKKTASGFQWFISKEFLLGEINDTSSSEAVKDPQESLTIQALLKQLEIKDKQIEELNTRLQEANILHKQLQDHLFERKQLEDKKPNIFRRFFMK